MGWLPGRRGRSYPAEMSDFFDLLVVGGGINGVGIARDAAGRGLKVLLCEKGDLAGATSSASSKMIHGGLRYLEHGAFRLVRESLAEREVLLRTAPHLVRPMRFVLPHGKGQRPRWMLRTGLFFYDRLGGARSLPASAAVDLRDGPLAAPLRDEVRDGFVYSDCVVDDARLTVANARDAARHGAEILTRTALVSAQTATARYGAPRSKLRTAPSGRSRRASSSTSRGRGFPTCCAVPADEPRSIAARQRQPHRRQAALPARPRLSVAERGSPRRVRDPVRARLHADRHDRAGGRQSGAQRVTPQEIDYLCRAVGLWFKRAPDPADVVWSYAGVRPLYDDGSKNASATSRDYVFELDDSGPPALSVFGGKLTTYRRLAEQALAQLTPHLPGMGPPWTRAAPLPSDDFLASTDGEFGPGLGRAEVEWLMREEWARSAEDILWRRSKLGLIASPEQVAALERFLTSKRFKCGGTSVPPSAPAHSPTRPPN
jgi:glycerol-3-phosphate dehydrogenase